MEKLRHDATSDHPEWNESYYFVFEDKNQTIRGMSRLGLKPNKDEAMAFLFLFLPDGSAAGYYHVETIEEPEMHVGSIQHDPGENAWTYKFHGKMIGVDNPEDMPKAQQDPKNIDYIWDVQMELNFDPLNDVYEYSEHMTKESLEIGKKAGDFHWEQIGLVNGTITLDGETFVISNIIGQRDHTHGVRDWTEIGDWLYYVIWFDENLAINPAAIITKDGRLSTGGFVFREGRNIPLKTIKLLDQKFRKDGIYPVSSVLELEDDEGNIYNLRGHVDQIIPLPFIDHSTGKMSILIQAFGLFDMDGKEGYGTFETLRKVG